MANTDGAASLDDLRIFLAVCEAGGFRKAARSLGLSVSTVSETVTRLEARLGVPLLGRTTRSVMPTEVGRQLAGRVAPVLSEARAALDEAASSQAAVRGRLRLNVPAAVMLDILPPLIDRYMAAHPQVRVEIVVEDRLVDITAADCDAGIRYGEHLEQDMIAIPIGPRRQETALAASPAYLERRGAPAHPRELLGHDCIRIRLSGAALPPWEFERGGEVLLVDPPAVLTIGSAGAMAAIAHAIAGRGVLYMFRNWIDPHLRSGALVPLLPDWWQRYDGPRLYFSRRLMPKPLRAFVDIVAQGRGAAGSALPL
ncbi:LysR family transcriptional regulator [Antarcticirhabdus aurantiaca]|uniref:LysR family transcriptional regulator n=1 Tax=Antarcticirhabdus aurantiaca TaxID=2606717 RepID=A0ACD4NNA7_9HYPH|nr:LysR family transcriptional regulator [Antarcticirhabdus aurantiaca]WAJ28171.1 LysR family transcriptional regulator [Jeongeuplla avenae]